MKYQSNNFETNAIHFGYNAQENEGALTPPVHFTSTFAFETAQAGGEMFAGEREGHFYTRISNPTLSLLEERMAILERAESALATASGMGAITSTLWTFLRPGDEIIVDKTLYGCTFSFLNHGLAEFGVKVIHIDLSDSQGLKQHLTKNTRVVFFETPANPNMKLVDIRAVSAMVHEFNQDIRVIVDNTYCSPFLCNPIAFGADLVIHSATKYLGGHGDLVAGLVVGNKDDIQAIRLFGLKDMTGAALAPLNAMLIMRGLKTLALRMERHCENALKVAKFLQSHPSVKEVSYPGLSSFKYHNLAQQQMKGFGGMITFEVYGGLEAGIAMMNQLNMIQRAVSLGDAETLIQHPASMTHSSYTPKERLSHGISDGLIRLSVGLESVDDILMDLKQALNCCVPASLDDKTDKLASAELA